LFAKLKGKNKMADYDENKRHGEPAVVYNVSNPHPGFGRDPNILNEFGHTKYPRFVDHPTEKDASGKYPTRVVVENEEEEKELLGKSSSKAPGWAGK
jgi:hypothetical protein